MRSKLTTTTKRIFVLFAGLALLVSGAALAQTAKPAKPPASAAPVTTRAPGPTPVPGATGGPGMGGPMMRGGGAGTWHGTMGGMGLCPLTGGPDSKVEVKKLPKGASITITSDDPHVIARIQKMAEAMRLMHEAETD